jgi:hypothetical protein
MDMERPDNTQVPVWLPLSEWNPAVDGLLDWAAAICTDYPQLRARGIGRQAVRELLGSGRAALFLDGFDELPEALRAAR